MVAWSWEIGNSRSGSSCRVAWSWKVDARSNGIGATKFWEQPSAPPQKIAAKSNTKACKTAANRGNTTSMHKTAMTDTPTMKDGEGGNVTLKFAGPPAEEVL